jgi:hypothetical protein
MGKRNKAELRVELLDTLAANELRIVLSGCFDECTDCGKLVPMSEVGLRHMGDGLVRNQSQCGVCRSQYYRGKR